MSFIPRNAALIVATLIIAASCSEQDVTAPPLRSAPDAARLSVAPASDWQLYSTYGTYSTKKGTWNYYDIAVGKFAAPYEYSVALVEQSGDAGLYVELLSSDLRRRQLVAAPMLSRGTDVPVQIDPSSLKGWALVRVWMYAFADSRSYVTLSRRMAPILWPLGGSGSSAVISGYRFGSLWDPGSCGGRLKLHTGIDYRATKGQIVYAAMDGVVRQLILDSIGWRYGMVIEDLSGSFTVTYWHIEPMVSVGRTLRAGDPVATVADLGRNTHFHLGYRNAAYSSYALAGALPQTACGGYPAFAERFVDPASVRFR